MICLNWVQDLHHSYSLIITRQIGTRLLKSPYAMKHLNYTLGVNEYRTKGNRSECSLRPSY